MDKICGYCDVKKFNGETPDMCCVNGKLDYQCNNYFNNFNKIN